MAEVYTFLEMDIKRVGSTVGGTAETAIDAYAEGVSVSVTRELQERVGDGGVVQVRIPVRTSVEMSIDRLWNADPFILDGNSIKLYCNSGGATGSAVWQMTKCWWEGKEWSADAGGGAASSNVTITGNSWGTV